MILVIWWVNTCMMSYYLERLNDLYICIYVVYTDISKRGITVKYIVVARVYVCVC